MRRGSLSGGDGHAVPAAFASLEDRSQPPHRARVLAFRPATRAKPLHHPVGERRRLRLEREAHARGPGRAGRELVDAERANAVVLASATGLDDAMGAIDLDERYVGPAEAVAGRFHAEARARPAPDRVQAGQMPVDEVVIGELAVVGDVL